MGQILNNGMEEIMFYKVSLFFHCPSRYIFLYSGDTWIESDTMFSVMTVYSWVSYTFVGVTVQQLINVFKYSTRVM